MKTEINFRRLLGLLFLLTVLTLFVAPEIVEARRGGRGFGRSFGRSRRSYSKPKRQTQSRRRGTPRSRNSKAMRSAKRPSFGGTRMKSSKQYTRKYGTPRKTETRTMKNAQGKKQRYVMNNYGGYGSGLMTGYMMGSITSSMMWMPWRGAFYYSKPYYVDNPDGTVSVYPPTFSWTKILFLIIIIGAIIFIVRKLIFNKGQYSSGSRSSFG